MKKEHEKMNRILEIITNADNSIEILKGEVKGLQKEYDELQEAGRALITISGGEKVAVGDMRLSVLSYFYAHKMAMLEGVDGDDVFADVDGAVNEASLREEVSNIYKYKKDRYHLHIVFFINYDDFMHIYF